MSDLFISYASVDRERTLQIADALRGQGIELWIDQAGISGGTAYGTEIANALREAGAVLLIASDTSLASKNVRQEIMLSWRYDKPIIPLILHPLVFPDDVAYWLEGAQWIEVFDRTPDEWLPKVWQSLARHGLVQDAPQPSANAPLTPAIEATGNLPQQLPAIVGREREIEEVLALLANGRTITLTGPGGTGKTRLALEVARRIGPSYAGGAWFLDLSAVQSAELVLPSIAELFELELLPDQPEIEGIAAALADRTILLLLDNLEQIPESLADLGALQAALPLLTLLLTSRVPLKLPGEWVYAVPQLPLPDLTNLLTPAALMENAAVRLFVERAKQARPDFQLIDGNARAVAEICHRLDGLPLAIEIAAARTRLLPPAAMLTRLGSRLNLLTRGNATNARQQTLRDTIAWSYNLLDPDQQRAFREFAVFTGGATLEAVETVLASSDGASPIDSVEGLADHSLLVIDATADGSARLRMLETLREFAAEQLATSGDAATVHNRHVQHFLVWLEESESELLKSRDGGTVRAVRAELGNLRAALAWLRDHDEARQRIRLVNALFPYWRIAGPYAEATQELSEAIASSVDAPPIARAKAISALGWLAAGEGDFTRAGRFYRDALDLYEREGDLAEQAATHMQLGFVAEYTTDYDQSRWHHERRLSLLDPGDAGAIAEVRNDLGRLLLLEGAYPDAIAQIREALEIYRSQADMQMIAFGLIDLASAEMLNADGTASLVHINESIALLRTLQDDYALCVAMFTLGRAEQLTGNTASAAVAFDQAMADAVRLGDANMRSQAHYGMGANAAMLEQWAEAEDHLRQAFAIAMDIGNRRQVFVVLETLAHVRAGMGQQENAASMLGRAEKECEDARTVISPAHRARYEATVAWLHEGLGPARSAELIAAGREMDAATLVAG